MLIFRSTLRRALVVLALTFALVGVTAVAAEAYAPAEGKAKYQDCWVNGGAKDIGFAAIHVYSVKSPDRKHKNPSNCKAKLKVYYQAPGKSMQNKIFIWKIGNSSKAFGGTISGGSVALRGYDLTACKVGCGATVSKRYPKE